MTDKIVVGMDTGGTFTDAFFCYGNRVEKVKVDTTPHDLTVCFHKCIEEGASRLGFSKVEDMLKVTEAIKFSSTIGSNALIQKRGPKLGLIVTKGYEKNLFSDSDQTPEVLQFVIQPNMIVGIDEEIDSSGKLIRSPNDKEVKNVLEYLLENGARIVVVSLKNAFYNPRNEERVKEIIRDAMPVHYLGSVPVLLCTEISKRPNDYLATNTTLLNAYLHRDLVMYLYKAEGNLQKKGYKKPLFIVLNNGGVVRLAKAKAIDSYGSGPTSGVFAMNMISKIYGLRNVAGIDIGGTSTDISFIKGGQYSYLDKPVIEGVPVDISMVDVLSAGGGGGSIARVNDGSLTVGPDSAGAIPGPASYDLGGIDPTPTDASVLLGIIDPNYFLEGKRVLSKDAAVDAVKSKVAEPLGVDIQEAACRIKRELENHDSREVEKVMKEKGYRPRDFTLFSFGGGGGSYCCPIADSLGISTVYAFNLSSVFCAYGAANMDILHVYEEYRPLKLWSERGAYLDDFDEFNKVVEKLEKVAIRDMRGEGFQPSDVKLRLALEMRTGSTRFTIDSPVKRIRKTGDIDSIAKKLRSADKKNVWVELFRLRSTYEMPRYKIPVHRASGKDPKKAFKAKREVWLKNQMEETSIYEQKLLECGNVIDGPAIIESEDTTVVLPEGWRYTLDKYLNGKIEKTR